MYSHTNKITGLYLFTGLRQSVLKLQRPLQTYSHAHCGQTLLLQSPRLRQAIHRPFQPKKTCKDLQTLRHRRTDQKRIVRRSSEPRHILSIKGKQFLFKHGAHLTSTLKLQPTETRWIPHITLQPNVKP